MEQELNYIADLPAPTVPRGTGFTRAQIAQAFHEAFGLIGGIPRLAAWADENPGKFFSLYAKLFPSSAVLDLGNDAEIIIRHAVPRGRLDRVTLDERGMVVEDTHA